MKNENKQIKVSSWALGILFVVSAVVLVLFFCVGFDNKTYFQETNKSLVDPVYTGLLLVWLYTLVGLCILSVLGFGIAAAIRNIKNKASGQRRTGFAGWVFLFTFIAVGVSYFMADTSKLLLGDEKTWAEDPVDLILSDVCLYSIYALFLVSLICVVLSMSGIFKARK
jgi:hypothetical protein